MEAFIEEHGHKNFYDHFDEYREMVKEYDQDTVDAFLGADFDISDISRLSDAYYGQYDSEEEFTENFVNECYGLPDMPSWIAIDWKKHGKMVYHGIIHSMMDTYFATTSRTVYKVSHRGLHIP